MHHFSKISMRVSPSESDKPTGPTSDADAGVKAAWYASEAFGDIVSLFRGKSAESEPAKIPEGKSEKLSWAGTVEKLRADYDRCYFVTGQLDPSLYLEDCEFADPFVSFKGLQRFKKNLDNLGPFMENVNLKITDWDDSEPGVVRTKWRFSCVLGLPWRPSLAAAGGTDHFFEEQSGKMIKHVEKWEIEPLDALKQIIRPGREKKLST